MTPHDAQRGSRNRTRNPEIPPSCLASTKPQPTSIDKRAVVALRQRYRPSEQAHVVVSPELDGRQPETIGIHELPQPWPGAVIEAHQIRAVSLVPSEFLPRVRRATGGLVEVVIDSRILVTLDQERVEAGARARCPLGRQV